MGNREMYVEDGIHLSRSGVEEVSVACEKVISRFQGN